MRILTWHWRDYKNNDFRALEKIPGLLEEMKKIDAERKGKHSKSKKTSTEEEA